MAKSLKFLANVAAKKAIGNSKYVEAKIHHIPGFSYGKIYKVDLDAPFCSASRDDHIAIENDDHGRRHYLSATYLVAKEEDII